MHSDNPLLITMVRITITVCVHATYSVMVGKHYLILGIFLEVPPAIVRFEQDNYEIDEGDRELEVCAVAEGLQGNASVPVIVLIAASSLTADGKSMQAFS